MAHFIDFGTDLVNLDHVITMGFSEGSEEGTYNLDMIFINGETVSRCVGGEDEMNNIHRQIRADFKFISIK